jgi:AraC family transcriptional regulator
MAIMATAPEARDVSRFMFIDAASASASTAQCAMMKAEYLRPISSYESQQTRDEIEILIPCDLGSFHVLYHAADAVPQNVVVQAPLVSIIPARQPYALRASGHCDVIRISLDQLFFERKVRDAMGMEAPALMERHAAVDPVINEVGNTLRSEFDVEGLPTGAYLESLAGVIAIHLASKYGRRWPSLPFRGLPPHKLHCVQAFIKEHFAEAIPVQKLAAAIHMSPYHFARMFKKSTGHPPHAYITMRRLERAKELLRESDLALVDVAANVGFQTQAHFTEVFHKHTGVTPRVFRVCHKVAEA